MADIRLYKPGDVFKISMTDEFLKDWMDKKNRETIIKCLESGVSYTIFSGKKVECCCNIEVDEVGEYEVFIVMDKKSKPIVLRTLKFLLDMYSQNLENIYTWSVDSDRNKKMHKLLGFVETDVKKGGRTLWVKRQEI